MNAHEIFLDLYKSHEKILLFPIYFVKLCEVLYSEQANLVEKLFQSACILKNNYALRILKQFPWFSH